MILKSRQYQTDLETAIYNSWAEGHQNTLAVLPTGGGKTWVFSNIIKKHIGSSVAIAHRQEIVSQISLSFAKHGIYHQILAPDNVIKTINKQHIEEIGESFYHPHAKTAVAGVRTLLSRRKKLSHWFNSVTLWVQDEAHHVLRSNEWGRAAALFPNAKGLGVTATAGRADGKGLGAHADGVMLNMVLGPAPRDLINQKYLADYRIFAPPSDLDMTGVNIGSNGDYTRPGTVKAVRKSTVTGDVIKHYLRIAPGKLGITFTVDVQTATETAALFNAAGVPAAVCSAKTPDAERVQILRKFRNREILMLVNVALFDEGFDVPGVEVICMAQPTKSFARFAQQFGRALRPDGDKIAIIIDHVGNCMFHGLPDAPRVWTLDRRERTSKTKPSDVIPVKSCPQCTAVYERIYKVCPYCAHAPKPMARSGPEYVDGDLNELDAATLAAMRGEAVNLDMTPAEYLSTSGAGHLPHIAAMSAAKQFRLKQEAQTALRESIALWAGYQKFYGRPDSESYRRFYFKFGVDVLSAQALNARDALALKLVVDNSVNIK